MTSPLRTLFWIACAASMLVGLLLTVSPWLVDGGFLGWINGLEYSREADVLMMSSAAKFTLGLVSAVIGIVIMLVLLALPLLHFAARGTWARRFDERGVTTFRGRTFAWRDFERIERIQRRRYFSHRELVFSTGRVVVPPVEMVKFPAELTDIVTELERGENRFTARAA